ncbi:MAG: hypothetical protein GVY06_10000 [Alphaproteobacteria bacterium]|jgi:multisubunit Na+/H+ antiporter MnhG subunit|nr:hypothetical protein [Alphaproteobacteria bacterium]
MFWKAVSHWSCAAALVALAWFFVPFSEDSTGLADWTWSIGLFTLALTIIVLPFALDEDAMVFRSVLKGVFVILLFPWSAIYLNNREARAAREANRNSRQNQRRARVEAARRDGRL